MISSTPTLFLLCTHASVVTFNKTITNCCYHHPGDQRSSRIHSGHASQVPRCVLRCTLLFRKLTLGICTSFKTRIWIHILFPVSSRQFQNGTVAAAMTAITITNPMRPEKNWWPRCRRWVWWVWVVLASFPRALQLLLNESTKLIFLSKLTLCY